MELSRWGAITAALVVLGAGCSRSETAREASGQDAPGREGQSAAFVNRVWRVSTSPSIEPGQLYAFLSEGTLVVASPHGTPALGRWSVRGNELIMVEEGIAYRVELLSLGNEECRLRVHNPGTPVEMTLVPAEMPLGAIPPDAGESAEE